MSSYAYLQRSTSNCVLFIENDQTDVLTSELANNLCKTGIVCAYIDYEAACSGELELFNAIAQTLKLTHAPYKAGGVWVGVKFLDDLITLSEKCPGVAIVVDNAETLLLEDRHTMFRLIEAFLVQFHHWFEKKKPCYLCLQMRMDPLVRQFFGQMV